MKTESVDKHFKVVSGIEFLITKLDTALTAGLEDVDI